jgi:hypothetical protein
LKTADIPENDPLLLPAITGASPPPPKRREVPRLQSFSKEEVEAEMARQTAAMLANKQHLDQPLNIPAQSDDIPFDV